MIGESPRAEDLYPGAAGLFRPQTLGHADAGLHGRAGGPDAVRWLVGLVAVGVALLVGRAVVGWMNRNL